MARKTEQFIDIANKLVDIEDAFKAACLEGHLEIAKMLREKKPNVYISIPDDEFADICGDGHFELAKWLLEVNPDIDISMNDYQSFSYACLSGNLELAEFLLEKSKKFYAYEIDAYVYNTTFSWVCTTTGDVKVAEWLVNKCPSIDIYGHERINFRNAFKNEYLELVDWFQRLKSTQIC